MAHPTAWTGVSTGTLPAYGLDMDVIGKGAVSSVDVADGLLAAASNGSLRGMAITPSPMATIVEALTPDGRRRVATLSRALGLATMARLALLAGVEDSEGGIGRIRVSVAGAQHEYIIDVGGAPEGSVEVLRLSAGPRKPPEDPIASGIREPVPYRVEAEIGRGGMGVVYKAFHRKLERYVAIKVLHPHREHQAADRDRFLREARAASRVCHPGVASVLDFGTLLGGQSYMVMELVEGETLRALLDRSPLDPLRAAGLMRRIASAVESAHEHGVIHRDLKPENIFVLANDQVKIIDFGAAKVMASAAPGDTAEGRVFGTPRYMAPEHAIGATTDRRTDVYALGCVLFEMISGRPPYDDEVATVVMLRHTRDPIPSLRLADAKLCRSLNAVMQRAMAKAPENRYPGARAFERDLARLIHAAERGSWWHRIGL